VKTFRPRLVISSVLYQNTKGTAKKQIHSPGDISQIKVHVYLLNPSCPNISWPVFFFFFPLTGTKLRINLKAVKE
jgi:hypothetical protein